MDKNQQKPQQRAVKKSHPQQLFKRLANQNNGEDIHKYQNNHFKLLIKKRQQSLEKSKVLYTQQAQVKQQEAKDIHYYKEDCNITQVSFSGLKTSRIIQYSKKKNRKPASPKVPLEVQIMNFNRTLIAMNESTYHSKSNSKSVINTNSSSRQKSKTRNIVDRFLQNSSTRTNLQTQLFCNQNIEPQLSVSTITHGDSSDPTQEQVNQESPKSQYSPDKYPNTKSPSRMFINKFEILNSSPQMSPQGNNKTTQRNSIVMFDVREFAQKKDKGAPSSQVKVYQRNRSVCRSQSHTDYIQFMKQR